MLQIKKYFVQQIDCIPHQRDNKAGDDANQRSERDQARFARSNQSAQTAWYLKSRCGLGAQDASPDWANKDVTIDPRHATRPVSESGTRLRATRFLPRPCRAPQAEAVHSIHIIVVTVVAGIAPLAGVHCRHRRPPASSKARRIWRRAHRPDAARDQAAGFSAARSRRIGAKFRPNSAPRQRPESQSSQTALKSTCLLSAQPGRDYWHGCEQRQLSKAPAGQ